jgi:site-specific recombinase XerD
MNGEDEELIETWFLKRNISTGTQRSYQIAIRYFSELIGKTPSELINEAETEEDAGIRPRKRRVSIYLLRYKKQLKEKVAPSTVNLYFSAIKSFYKAFDITLPEIKLDKGDIGLEKNIGRSLTREDILKLVSVASTREKALIYLMAMSGMGQQEARDLTIKKFLSSAAAAINKELKTVDDLFQNENEVLNEVLTLEIRRKKVNYKYHTFIPPEVSREILTYLKERCYGRNEKIRIKDQNEPIFVNNYGGRLSRDSIVTNFRRIGKQAGFQKEKGAYAYWRSHSLRKYFISTIINKIGEKTIADYMAGHKISDQDRTYWRANLEDLKKHYLKTLPYLSLDTAKVKDVETKEFKIIMEDSKKKDKKIEDLEKTVKLLKEKLE